jgi:pSer/pThr/pTyr-binding forkhead associated (FHA) protein
MLIRVEPTNQVPFEFSLRAGVNTVGRDESAMIKIEDNFSSRLHLHIVVHPDQTVTVEDLGSTNGTLLNEQSLTQTTQLRVGDVLRIGQTRLTLQPANQATMLLREERPSVQHNPFVPPPPPSPPQQPVYVPQPPPVIPPMQQSAYVPPPPVHQPAYAPPPYVGFQSPPPSNSGGTKATVSLVLGIVGLIFCIVPFLGFILSIVAIVLGALSLKSSKASLATIGIILGVLGIFAAIFMFFVNLAIYFG